MKKRFYFLLLICALLTACKDDDEQTAGLLGEWEWVQSIGGDNGETLTPLTEGVTRHLEIDLNTYKAFENDSLIFESTYLTEIRTDSFFGSNVFLVFPGGAAQSIIREDDELILSEYGLHRYTHTYVKR